jgi:trehalose 6-phosphate phosphatase
VPNRRNALIASLQGTLDQTLVALDFDGTLAPVVPDPGASRPTDGAIEVMCHLAAAGAQLAVVTGRAADTALKLGRLDAVPGLIIEGNYGAERWQDGRLSTPGTPASIYSLRRELPALLTALSADPAVWIEDKRLSLVVHARRATDPEAALLPLREPMDALVAGLGLEAHPGRNMIEVRLPGFDKGGALRRLLEETGRRQVLFAGDDLGDLPAFALLAELRATGQTAWSVAVASDEAPEVAAAAMLTVADPAALVDLLTRLVDTAG